MKEMLLFLRNAAMITLVLSGLGDMSGIRSLNNAI